MIKMALENLNAQVEHMKKALRLGKKKKNL